MDALAGKNGVGQQGLLGSFQLCRGDRFGRQPFQLLPDELLDRGRVLVLEQLDLEAEPAGIAPREVRSVDPGGHLFPFDQLAVQPSRTAAGQQRLDHVQDGVLGLVLADGGEAHQQPRRIEFRGHLHPGRQLRLLERNGLARRQLAGGNGTEVFADQFEGLLRVETADDDQGGIVGMVPAIVVGLDDLGGGPAHMVAFADDRMPIGCLGAEQQRQNGFLLQIPRLVLVAGQFVDDGALLLLELVPFVNASWRIRSASMGRTNGQRSAAKSK